LFLWNSDPRQREIRSGLQTTSADT
jgi:hypothetical protein